MEYTAFADRLTRQTQAACPITTTQAAFEVCCQTLIDLLVLEVTQKAAKAWNVYRKCHSLDAASLAGVSTWFKATWSKAETTRVNVHVIFTSRADIITEA